MTRHKLQLRNHLTTEQLKSRYRACRNVKEARRWQVLLLTSMGYTPAQVSEIVGLGTSWVREVIKRFNQYGAESVVDQHTSNPGGARPKLSNAQKKELSEDLKRDPPGGGSWTGAKVAAWITERTGTKTYPQLGWVYLKNLKASKTSERNRSAPTDNESH